jgi:succinate dehydrogenase / fumarate reductase cytochrome b subunit
MSPSPERPLSPHLQIYKMTKITSLTSILHRITGVALVAGSVLILWWLMALAHGPQAYADFSHAAQSLVGKFILLGFTWAFWYQFINGLRHLGWDAGLGFKIEFARKTGVFVLLASFAATAVTWLVI